MRLLALAGLCVALASAQTFTRKEPAVYRGPAPSGVAAQPPGIRLSLAKAREWSLAPLSQREAAGLRQPGTLLKIGVHRPLPLDVLSTGTWETTADGAQVWRMALRSPGAQGIRVEFRNFSVGKGQVWLHDGANVAGPYSGRGLFDDGHFWSATIFSESVTLEYEPEPGAAAGGALPFEIRTISHRGGTASRGRLQDTPDAGKADPADYCHLDPNCYSDWKPAMSMVAQLLFEDGGYQYFCSGSAIATRDDSFKPYLLTAGHCIHSEDAARSLETFWTYQTSSCGGALPNRGNSTTSSLGAHLIDSGTLEQGDYSLVLLKDVPSGVTFSGWDTGDPDIGSSLTGMHHPMGSWKRVSFGNRVGDASAVVEGNLAPGDLFLQVQWAQGRTEPGSSGSPLFSSPGVIVGTLTYGPYSPELSACEISPAIDGYGRFSNAYAHLHDYLENLPAAAVNPGTSALSFTVNNRVAPKAQTVQLKTQSNGAVAFKLRADAPWIQVSTASGTVSQNAPAQVQISIDPTKFDRPDLYTSTVTVLSGAAAPVFINVTADVRITDSNVQVSISPNSVTASNGQWQFAIQLAETGGAATRVTAVKVNGTDYSSYITGWFGTSHIPAMGTIQAPLTAAGVFAPGTQYFEFWGVDDNTGQQWYRVATVRFQ